MTQAETALFVPTHCDEVVYRFTVGSDKFELSEFLAVVNEYTMPHGWTNVICPSNSDYHTHLSWMVSPKREKVMIQVGFHEGEPEDREEKLKLASEDCMLWVGQFFKNQSAHAHIHADFEFPSGRKSRFPLPLGASIGESKVEIDGVSFSMRENHPAGVTTVWVTQRKHMLNLQLVLESRIIFKSFSIAGDIGRFLPVIDELTEVVQ